jgi:hypothetical protein
MIDPMKINWLNLFYWLLVNQVSLTVFTVFFGHVDILTAIITGTFWGVVSNYTLTIFYYE